MILRRRAMVEIDRGIVIETIIDVVVLLRTLDVRRRIEVPVVIVTVLVLQINRSQVLVDIVHHRIKINVQVRIRTRMEQAVKSTRRATERWKQTFKQAYSFGAFLLFC